MGMVEVFISSNVVDYLNELALKLFHKKYFSFPENADKYINKIFDAIENNIHLKQHKKSAGRLLKYGPYHCTIISINKISWVVFFDKKDNRYIVEYITNSKAPIYSHIRGFRK
jgi:hypothetical protein